MSHILVDAQLLACPTAADYSDDVFQTLFTDFLARLCDLSSLRSSCRSVKFWRDEELSNVLHETDSYPFRHSLSKAFAVLFDPSEFQMEDVNVLATSLLEKSARLEDQGAIKDIIVSKCSLTGDPASNRSEIFLNHLCRVLALALPIVGNGTIFNKNTFLASCGDKTSEAVLQAKYHVELVELDTGEVDSNFGIFSVEIPNYRGMLTMLAELDLSEWWTKCDSVGMVEICAVAACGDRSTSVELISMMTGRISVGLDFVSSARALGFMNDRKKINRIIRVCADLLLDRNLADSHWLRSGKGANDPQRSSGDWKAWRHDIDDEFHLHFWRQEARIELANIVTHNDFAISR